MGELESGQLVRVGPGPGGRLFLRPPTLTAGNFAALWPTDPKFLALKDLNLFKTVSKVQKTSSILRVGFALPKWPHLHRAYVVGGCFLISGLYHEIQYTRLQKLQLLLKDHSYAADKGWIYCNAMIAKQCWAMLGDQCWSMHCILFPLLPFNVGGVHYGWWNSSGLW